MSLDLVLSTLDKKQTHFSALCVVNHKLISISAVQEKQRNITTWSSNLFSFKSNFLFKYTLRNKKLYMTAVVVYCEVVYDFILLHSGSFRSDLNHKCKNHSISAFPRCRTNKGFRMSASSTSCAILRNTPQYSAILPGRVLKWALFVFRIFVFFNFLGVDFRSYAD